MLSIPRFLSGRFDNSFLEYTFDYLFLTVLIMSQIEEMLGGHAVYFFSVSLLNIALSHGNFEISRWKYVLPSHRFMQPM